VAAAALPVAGSGGRGSDVGVGLLGEQPGEPGGEPRVAAPPPPASYDRRRLPAHLPAAARHARIRRPTVETRALVAQITAEDPDITRTELARRVGVSTRRLREVLAT
jgi:hypothetical protein